MSGRYPADIFEVKYVALLAFNRIVTSHPYLVSAHEDVIMRCIDDPDISIRMQALDLGAGMVNSDNIITVVEGLMKQLRNAPLPVNTVENGGHHSLGVEPAADSDGEDPEETLRPSKETQNEVPALPTEYRVSIISRILDMCSKDTYANILDFEWYVETLMKLVRLLRTTAVAAPGASKDRGYSIEDSVESVEDSVSCAIGWELRNVAVRVSSIRPEAVHIANSLLINYGSDSSEGSTPEGCEGVLQYAAWIVGEYAGNLLNAHSTLTSLIQLRNHSLPPVVLSAYIQSAPKVMISVILNEELLWNSERKTMLSLLLARIVHFLEPLSTHPSLEVQERSVELLELMRVAMQAVTGHDADNDYGPLLLTKAIPALFSGSELNPVAPNAQEKVPQPDDLDLDTPINQNLLGLLQGVDEDFSTEPDFANFEGFYNHRPNQKAKTAAAFDALPPVESGIASYQQSESDTLDPDALTRKRIERQGRNRDDPFYIASDDPSSGTSTPFHDILRNTNGEDVDVDSIPIMNLELGDMRSGAEYSDVDKPKPKRKHPKKFHIATDETIHLDETMSGQNGFNGGRATDTSGPLARKRDKSKKTLLEVDSSGLGGFSLEGDENGAGQLDVEKREVDDAEMAKALQEVERLRLEMQRASERVQAADGVPPEGTLVKKKKNKKKKNDKIQDGTAALGTQDTMEDGVGVESSVAADVIQTAKPKKKKKKSAALKHDDHKAISNGQQFTDGAPEYS